MCTGEENAVKCWNCRRLLTCQPYERPKDACLNYEPMGRYITTRHVADMIGISVSYLYKIIEQNGLDKVLDMLDEKGYCIEYERVSERIKFYEIEKR